MMHPIGTVLESEDGFYVVAEAEKGQAVVLQKIERYVEKIAMLDYEGESRYLKEILDIKVKEYMEKNTVIRF